MPDKEVWIARYANLMNKLSLPCELRFTTDVRVGRHVQEDDGACHIDVNLSADFHVPEHLLLHEGAHHRAAQIDEYHGHDEFWARILLKMYEEAGIDLPETTGFFTFATVAGIKHRNEYL